MIYTVTNKHFYIMEYHMETLHFAVNQVIEQFEIHVEEYIDGELKDATIDSCGRYHAPHDAFFIAGKAYRKGEFIPLRDDVDIFLNVRKEFKDRYKVKFSNYEELDGELFGGHAEFSFGSKWQVDGEDYCYMYVKTTTKRILNAIAKHVELSTVKRDVVLLEEGKYEVVAKLIKTNIEAPYYEYGNGRTVATFLLENGAILVGTLPSKVPGTFGINVKFTATISNNGKCNFYKRPSKVSIIEGEV